MIEYQKELLRILNFTAFARLLKDLYMGCKGIVLHRPFLKKKPER